MTDAQKKEIVKNGLEFVHCAIQEAMNGNMGELMTALEVLELMREDSNMHWSDGNLHALERHLQAQEDYDAEYDADYDADEDEEDERDYEEDERLGWEQV